MKKVVDIQMHYQKPDLKWPFDDGTLVHQQNSTPIFVEQTKNKPEHMSRAYFSFRVWSLEDMGPL